MDGLDERKVKILEAIIRTYLETGEPVGSRTISKYTDLNLSSATIRNEMSDLEELGYLTAPHTSAGRIPSDQGYRFYVDHLLKSKDKEISDMKEFVIEHTEKMEKVLKQVAKVLAQTTNYATMISSPNYNANKVKFIQLSQLDENQLLAVIQDCPECPVIYICHILIPSFLLWRQTLSAIRSFRCGSLWTMKRC